MDASTGKTMSKDDYVRLAEFRYALRRYLAFSRQACLSRGLTPQQHQALLSICSKPDRDKVTVSELAEHLCIQLNSAVELVDRLVDAGLVVREPFPDDRRKVLVALTSEARQKLQMLSETNMDELKLLAPSFAALVTSLTRTPAG